LAITAAILSFFVVIPDNVESKSSRNSGNVTIRVTIDAPKDSTDVKLWIPYPVSDKYQSIRDISVEGNFSSQAVYGENTTGNLALYAEWKKPVDGERYVDLSFKAVAMERVQKGFALGKSELPSEVKPYLRATRFIPVDGKIREIALQATRGKKTTVDKARAVYDWVVENTSRDPNVKGCGLGDVERTLAERSGKCADISSVYVALARAAGVPAREVFGLRLGSKPGTTDMTGGHHCWSEFYAPGYGWVPTDPADVRKIMLAEKLDLKQAKKYREYYFGAVGPNRIVLGHGGRGYYLNPKQSAGPLNYFMYPYAEVDGKSLEWLAAQKRLKYKITYKSSDSSVKGLM
jgi:transglutaminase-like putative cysteine protease